MDRDQLLDKMHEHVALMDDERLALFVRIADMVEFDAGYARICADLADNLERRGFKRV